MNCCDGRHMCLIETVLPGMAISRFKGQNKQTKKNADFGKDSLQVFKFSWREKKVERCDD
jgi:hypothetical protein